MGFALTLDSWGNIYFTGNFNGASDFDPGSGIFNLNSVGSPGNYDIFIAKINNSGNFLWAKSMGGSSIETGFAIAVNSSGYSVLTVGQFYSSNVDFDPSALTYTLSSFGNWDAFVCRLSGISTDIQEYTYTKYFDAVYPNPTNGKINFKRDFLNNTKSIIITNSVGQIVVSKDFSEYPSEVNEMDLSFLPKGFYLINKNGIMDANSVKLIIN